MITSFKRILLKLPFHNISIRNKLMIYFLALVLVPLSIIMIILYSKSMQIISKKINFSVERSLGMAEDNIKSKFEAAFDYSTYIYLNEEFQNILSAPRPSNSNAIYDEMVSINSIVNNYYFHSTINTRFFPTVYMINSLGYNKFNFSKFVFSSSKIEKEKWFKDMPKESEYTVIGPGKATMSSGTINTIKIARRLYGIKNSSPTNAAILTVDINLDEFINIIGYFKPSPNSTVLILDKEGKVVAGTNSGMIGKILNQEDINLKIKHSKTAYGSFTNRGVTLVSYRYLKQVDWYMVSLSPLSEINGELVNLKKVMLFVLCICIILVVIISLYLSENISYPIRKLVKSMSAVKEGNLNIKLEYKRNDEFLYLFTAYKNMISEIKSLIEKVKLIEVDKKEAELKVLQSQINPHFLYNTLDSVNLFAMKYKVPEISTMVTSLSDFFRYSLNKGKGIITLMDEKRQVESYMTIQKIRFRDKIDFSIDFPPEILDNITVKLILQPIVENAILHGIEKRKGMGFIIIKAQKNGEIIEIEVIDNGVGANIDELNDMLLEKSISKKSFAVKNVNERIKQFFGEEYGIKFFNNSSDGVISPGTKVVITIPAVKNWGNYNA